jgi:hypothetical protein
VAIRKYRYQGGGLWQRPRLGLLLGLLLLGRGLALAALGTDVVVVDGKRLVDLGTQSAVILDTVVAALLVIYP